MSKSNSAKKSKKSRTNKKWVAVKEKALSNNNSDVRKTKRQSDEGLCNFENVDEELCVRLLGVPSVQNYSGLKKLLQNSCKEWMQGFLELDGLGMLFESLERLCDRGFCFSDAILQIECVACIRAVMNSKTGLDYIIQHVNYTRKLAKALDTNNIMVKKQVFELLSALCVYSEEGYHLAIDALESYKVVKNQRYRFSLLVNELRDAEITPYKTTIMAFINCIILNTDDFHDRVRIRNEFIGLHLLDQISKLRQEDDEELYIQCDVFDRSKETDESGLDHHSDIDITSHHDVFHAIFQKICSTPQAIPFLSILQNLLQLDPDKPHSDLIWDLLERIAQQAVQLESKDAINKLCNKAMGDVANTFKKRTKEKYTQTIHLNRSKTLRNRALFMVDKNTQTESSSCTSQDINTKNALNLILNSQFSKSCESLSLETDSPLISTATNNSTTEYSRNILNHSEINGLRPPKSPKIAWETEVISNPLSTNSDYLVKKPSQDYQNISDISATLPNISQTNKNSFSSEICRDILTETAISSVPTHCNTSNAENNISCDLVPLKSAVSSPFVPPSPSQNILSQSLSNNLSIPPPPPPPSINSLSLTTTIKVGIPTPPPPPPFSQSIPLSQPISNIVNIPPPPPPPPTNVSLHLVNNNIPPPPPPPPISFFPVNLPNTPPNPPTPISVPLSPSPLQLNFIRPPPPPPPPGSTLNTSNSFNSGTSPLISNCNTFITPQKPAPSFVCSSAPPTSNNIPCLPMRTLAQFANISNGYSTFPRPKSKMKTLNWVKVPSTLISNKNNVWKSVQNLEMNIKLDFDKMEELFCQKTIQNTPLPAPTKAKKEFTEISLLDNKRSLNVNIFLKQFKCSNEAIMELLKQGNSSEIGAEKLRGLLRILPEKEELLTVKQFDGDKSKLGNAEKFYLLLSGLPAYTVRIEGLLLKEEFGTTYEQLKLSVDTLIKASSDLLENKALKEFLLLTLESGNFLNAGCYAGNALGFKINTLPKLSETRSNRPRMTLLHFLVEEAEKLNKLMLSFPEDMKFLKQASRLSVEALTGEINSLSSSVRKLQNQLKNSSDDVKNQFTEFAKMADAKCKELETGMAEIRSILIRLAQHFCEDENKFKVEECLGLFSSFCDNVVQAQKENQQRKVQEEKAERMKKQKEESKLVFKKGKSFQTKEDSEVCIVDRLLEEIRRGDVKLRKTRSCGAKLNCVSNSESNC